MLCGRGAVSMAAVEEFFEFAGGAQAKIVVVSAGSDKHAKSLSKRLAEQADQATASAVQLLRVSKDKRDMPGLAAALAQATGVWLVGENVEDWPDTLEGTSLQDGCRGVMKRGGAIAASGTGSALMGRYLALL